MNLEEQNTNQSEDKNHNTASLSGSKSITNVVNLNVLNFVQNNVQSSVSNASLPTQTTQSGCVSCSERENSGFSIIR